VSARSGSANCSKPTGPAEFLPILLSLTTTQSSAFSTEPQLSGILSPDEILPFLNDLANGVSREQLVDTITPTLSLCFQAWFGISPTPDISGPEWRQYLGAVATLTQVKQIAAEMPSLGVWVAQGVTAPKIEYQSILGPLTRLSVYPREFVSHGVPKC
jgi:ubiquitin conjugation factor E4 B